MCISMGVTVNMISVGGVDVMHVCYISVGDEEMLSGVWVVKRDICVCMCGHKCKCDKCG